MEIAKLSKPGVEMCANPSMPLPKLITNPDLLNISLKTG